MAQRAIPEEINRHFEAALALLRRDLLRRLVNEAELCIKFGQATAAAILAGIALEELSSLSAQEATQTLEPSFKALRELLSRSGHTTERAQKVDRKVVASMVAVLRTLLNELDRPDVTLRNPATRSNALASIRGKYAFVPTSVEDFLSRKREDTDLENPG